MIKTIELTKAEFDKVLREVHEKFSDELLNDDDIDVLTVVQMTVITGIFSVKLKQALFDKEG